MVFRVAQQQIDKIHFPLKGLQAIPVLHNFTILNAPLIHHDHALLVVTDISFIKYKIPIHNHKFTIGINGIRKRKHNANTGYKPLI